MLNKPPKKTDNPQNTAAKVPPYLTALDINRNSLNILSDGGADALPTHNKNQKQVNIGDIDIHPRLINIFRLPLFSYSV